MSDRHSTRRRATIRALDHGFVAAKREMVFEVLRDPEGYAGWWPGARSLGDGRLRVPGLPAVVVSTERVRLGTGLVVRVSDRRPGGINGHLEWYLENFEEGTVVSCIADLRAPRPWRPRRVLRLRSGVRSAMVALKGMLE
ncbi:MAG TPA: SRPBCC family protein [Actinomycetota bacterium]